MFYSLASPEPGTLPFVVPSAADGNLHCSPFAWEPRCTICIGNIEQTKGGKGRTQDTRAGWQNVRSYDTAPEIASRKTLTDKERRDISSGMELICFAKNGMATRIPLQSVQERLWPAPVRRGHGGQEPRCDRCACATQAVRPPRASRISRRSLDCNQRRLTSSQISSMKTTIHDYHTMHKMSLK